MIDFPYICNEPEKEYHARSKSGEFMSSHLLADFRESPLKYYKKINGEIPDADTQAFAFGRAAHKLILEGMKAYDAAYEVSDGPVNVKTGKPYGKNTNAYLEWAASVGRPVISTAEDYDLNLMRDGVMCNPTAAELLKREGVAEGVVRAEVGGVPCQIRMDYFTGDSLIDLKTAVELRFFEYEVRRFGYIYQLAFYRDVLKAASKLVPVVYLIAVEKEPPYSAGVWQLTADALESASGVNAATLARYRKCRETNEWPTGYETLRFITEL